jgi:hypothetical protein
VCHVWSVVCVDGVDLMKMRGHGSVYLCADVSLSGNRFGAEGGAAIAGVLPHLSSLTTLQYVGSEGRVWG